MDNTGISYLSRVQEEEAIRALSLRYGCEYNNLNHVERIPLVSASDILFTERMKIKLRVWQESLLQNSSNENRASTSSRQQFQTVFYKLRPAILLNGFTSHQLRLIKLVIPLSSLENTFEFSIYSTSNGASPSSFVF